jgi:hypothetical protein
VIIVSTVFLDKILRPIDRALGVQELPLTIYLIFVFESKHIINGIEEREVTSDMINIVINGYFKWSIHGSHYDFAPLDTKGCVKLYH